MIKANIILAVVFLLLVWVGFADNRYDYLRNLSMNDSDARHLISSCEGTKSSDHCIQYGGAIRAQEWGYWTRHSFGLLSTPSRAKGKWLHRIDQRVWSYTRYWYKNKTANQWITRSRYCVTWCQHRVPNVTRFIAWYKTWIIPQETLTDEKLYKKEINKPNETPALSKPLQKGCRWIGTAREWQRLQIDSHTLLEWIFKFFWIEYNRKVEKGERILAFIC